MSASLVGSEMCIRDRAAQCERQPPPHQRGKRRDVWGRVVGRWLLAIRLRPCPLAPPARPAAQP
eukprot:111155-Alexandrium_andersonii.AAC.1